MRGQDQALGRCFKIKRYLLPPLSEVLEAFWANSDNLMAQSLITARNERPSFDQYITAGSNLTEPLREWRFDAT